MHRKSEGTGRFTNTISPAPMAFGTALVTNVREATFDCHQTHRLLQSHMKKLAQVAPGPCNIPPHWPHRPRMAALNRRHLIPWVQWGPTITFGALFGKAERAAFRERARQRKKTQRPQRARQYSRNGQRTNLFNRKCNSKPPKKLRGHLGSCPVPRAYNT